jgi:glucose-1-phosphate cytidylyltransferase
MREETEFKPKPMVEIGNMPVLLHIMWILGSQGIRDFIVCTGYKGDVVRDYFLNFQSRFNDFTIGTKSKSEVVFHPRQDVPDWNVTVAETGSNTSTGGRILAVKRYLEGERFLATYGDGLADIDLKALTDSHIKSGKLATLTVTQPRSRYGVVQKSTSGEVQSFVEKPEGNELVNIGYFVFEAEIFDYLDYETPLETAPLQKLVAERSLNSYEHRGFFQPMDTQRELDDLRALWDSENAPWRVWK